MKKFAIGKDVDQNIIYINDRVKFFTGEYANESELEIVLFDFFLNEIDANSVKEIKHSHCLSLVDRKTGIYLPKKESSARIKPNDDLFAFCRVVKESQNHKNIGNETEQNQNKTTL